MATVEKLKNVKAKSRYRTISGEIVPGVTTVLGVLNKPALIHWSWDLGMQGIDYRKFRDKLASIGTLAHYLIECDIKKESPDLEAYSQEEVDLAENCLLSYYEWKRGKDIFPVMSEGQLVSEKYKYGGTIDLYGSVDGTLNLVDFKTGKAIYPEMIAQLAAYLQLLTEHGCNVKKVRILRIGRDEKEGFEEQIKTPAQLRPYWRLFQHCLKVYQLQKEIGRD